MRDKAEQVRAKAEYLRGAFTSVGNRYIVGPLEEDETTPPSGTNDYPGRVLAFNVEESHGQGRQLRVLIEDVTIDE